MKKRLLLPLIPAAAVSLALAAPAFAATPEAVSENWAGYESTASSGSGFSGVSGGWTQPAISDSSGETTYSAYWVGIGGGSQNSDALEQIGTQADYNSTTGKTSYYAWYELVPKAPVKINMTVNPGDKMWARVGVSGDQVTLFISDQTTGKTFSKTLTMSNPDTSTAEWVAEAPSECQGGATGNCTPLPLSDFGTVKFTDAHATAGGKTGTISSFDSDAIALEPSSSSFFGDGPGGYGQFGSYGEDTAGDSSSGGAAPGSLSSDGTTFTVTYGGQASAESSAGDGYTNPSSSGYGDSGYGESGYGESGYGYGDSGYGYGDSGYGDSGYGYGDSGYGYGYPSSTSGYGYSYTYPSSGVGYSNGGFSYGY
jgi:hypothetical protein